MQIDSAVEWKQEKKTNLVDRHAFREANYTVWVAVHAQIVRVTSRGPFFLVVDGKWRDGKCVFLSLVMRFLHRGEGAYLGGLFRFSDTLLIITLLRRDKH